MREISGSGRGGSRDRNDDRRNSRRDGSRDRRGSRDTDNKYVTNFKIEGVPLKIFQYIQDYFIQLL